MKKINAGDYCQLKNNGMRFKIVSLEVRDGWGTFVNRMDKKSIKIDILTKTEQPRDLSIKTTGVQFFPISRLKDNVRLLSDEEVAGIKKDLLKN